MDAIERAVPAPQIEITVQGRARRQVLRNRPPLATRAQDVHQPVDDLAQIHAAFVAAPLGRRDARRDQRPLPVGQVGRIAQEAAVIPAAVFCCPHRRLPPKSGRLS